MANPYQFGKRGSWLYSVTLSVLMTAIGSAVLLSYIFSMNALGWEGSRSSVLAVPVGQFFPAQNRNIVLYASPNTRRYLASVGGNYEVLLKPWRNLLVQAHIPFNEMTALSGTATSLNDVLILPSAIALDEQERKAILAFQQQGGSILATSALSARAGDGAWTGYDFPKLLFGVMVRGEILPDQDERNLNLFGDLPFTHTFRAGERIWLGRTGANPLRLQGGNTAGNLSNWSRTKVDRSDDTAAVLFDEMGPDKKFARWVMLSFPETTWEIQRNDIHGLIVNAIDWLERRPVVYQATWPYPHRAAHIIGMDTEEGFQNAPHFTRLLEQAKLRATLYMLTSSAMQHRDIARQLGAQHEIAYHGDVHEGFKDQPESAQAARIDKMQADMKTIFGDTTNISGFRAPLESYNAITEALLAKKGILHHAADPNRTPARLPFFEPGGAAAGSQSIVVLPRTQRDDLNVLQDTAGVTEKVAQALIEDFDTVTMMGGLGLFSLHSQNFEPTSPLAKAFPQFLAHARSQLDEAWIAPASAIAHWWRERQRLAFKVTRTGTKINLYVTLSGVGAAEPLSLVITHPVATEAVNINPVTSKTVLPQIHRIDRFRSALVFTGMKPGSHTYSITFADAAKRTAN